MNWMIAARSTTTCGASTVRSSAPAGPPLEPGRRPPHHVGWAGDKGYSYPRLRRWCKRRGVEAVIPTRKNQPRDDDFDKETYKRRNIVERVVGWFKEYRRLGTRYEKLAVNYVAMWMVAIIEKTLFRLLPNTA
jgi:transposase